MLSTFNVFVRVLERFFLNLILRINIKTCKPHFTDIALVKGFRDFAPYVCMSRGFSDLSALPVFRNVEFIMLR